MGPTKIRRAKYEGKGCQKIPKQYDKREAETGVKPHGHFATFPILLLLLLLLLSLWKAISNLLNAF